MHVGLLQTNEPITRSFSLHETVVLNIYVFKFGSHAPDITSLAWYHNGTKISSRGSVGIANNGKSLTISKMTESDAGRYEVKINSIGSDRAICDQNLLPMFEQCAPYAPVTFLLQESNQPTYYNEVDIILEYAQPAYQGTQYKTFVFKKNIMINVAAVLDVTRIKYYLVKHGIPINRNSFNIAASYDKVITVSARLTYNNTDDITGHYNYQAYADYSIVNKETCPAYYKFYRHHHFTFPVFNIYFNIRSYGK